MLSKILHLMFYTLPLLSQISIANGQQGSSKIDLSWHPPEKTEINTLSSTINATGVYGFIFNSSQNPRGTPYDTYNWCNMPHVRPQGYKTMPKEYKLEYVEVIHRHHKRTPYAANTFPVESYPWYCNDSGLFYYGEPSNPSGNRSTSTYWSVFTDDTNPFTPEGFRGDCEFPQITKEGLNDAWQHGKDLYGVYHTKLGLIPDGPPSSAVSFRVTNNVITSQVAGMVVNGMFSITSPYPLLIQPDDIDSLEPTYTCDYADTLYSNYGVGGNNTEWLAHLRASKGLFATLDAISGIDPASEDWHKSWDHYFDNLSARLCHEKPLPCNGSTGACITQAEANEVFRLGEYEYSYIYRDAPQSLEASRASFGIWIAELRQHLANVKPGKGDGGVVYRHNVAHDGSISRLLSVLQIDIMVWPGMGSEVVFELYSNKSGKSFVRILWGGQTLQSSNPTLNTAEMVPLDILLAYFDGLVGQKASLIPKLCSSSDS